MLNYTLQPDLNVLAKRIRAINTEKDFWPKEGRNWGEVCTLIISELMEALEAHRKGRRATGGAAKLLIEQHGKISNWPEQFVGLVKDTVDDEMADAVIRILDCSEGQTFNDISDWLPDLVIETPENFGESLLPTIKDVSHVGLNGAEFIGFYTRAEWIANIEAICRKLNIDLWAHVEAKILYNQTRPAKHGKLY